MTFFATFHGKGIVVATGGNHKSIVHQKTFSKGKGYIIMQNAENFSAVSVCFIPSNSVVYIDESTTKEENLKEICTIKRIIHIPCISKMHLIKCTKENVNLNWGISNALCRGFLLHPCVLPFPRVSLF